MKAQELMQINDLLGVQMDFIDDALKRYNTKMAMPQYEAYQNNEQMQQALWEDCLREAEFTAECRSRRENAYRFT